MKPIAEGKGTLFEANSFVSLEPNFQPRDSDKLLQEFQSWVPDEYIKRYKAGDASKAFFGGFDAFADACSAAGWLVSNSEVSISSITIFDVTMLPLIVKKFWPGKFWVCVMAESD